MDGFPDERPNRIWLADLTYIPTGEGWLYLAAILDMHTRKIVGWSMRETLHATIAIEALHMAIRRPRPPHGLIHHSNSKYAGASVAGRSDPHSDGPFSVAGAAWSPAVA